MFIDMTAHTQNTGLAKITSLLAALAEATKVDPATQEMRLRYWQDVLHKLDEIPRAQLSPEQQINYDVYRPEMEDFVADEKFRDYEMPANSDSAFWSDLGRSRTRIPCACSGLPSALPRIRPRSKWAGIFGGSDRSFIEGADTWL